jgi:hypothetical protein
VNKRIAAGVLAGLLAGAGAGVALGTPGLASGQESPDTTEAPATDDGATTEETRPERGQWITDALAPLVEAQTINQAQADAVIAALDAARPERGPGGPGMHRGSGGRGLETAATALGITSEELVTALRGGQSIAEVATAQGTEPQVVIDAMLAEVKTHLDEHVAAGDLTQERADERLARATEGITAMVNGERPAGGPGGRHGGRGMGPGADADTPEATGTSA